VTTKLLEEKALAMKLETEKKKVKPKTAAVKPKTTDFGAMTSVID